MALYSWFSRTNKKPNVKNVNTNDNLLNTADTVKYIENYTMWPTAKVKMTNKVIIPTYVDTSVKKPEVALPTSSQLTVIKAN